MALVPATPPEAAAPPPEIVAMSTERLREALSRSLARTASELVRLAWIVRVLEERGEDLADLNLGLLHYLRYIAYGRLVPEAVVRFAADPALLQKVAALPTPDQKRLASGEPLAVVVRRGDAFDQMLIEPKYLTGKLRRQVFAKDHLRDVAEQTALLQDRSASPPERNLRFGRCTADPRRGGVRVGRTFVPAADVVAALAALKAGAEVEEADGGTVVIAKLNDAQHRSLKLAATRGDTSMQALIVKALAAYGLLNQK